MKRRRIKRSSGNLTERIVMSACAVTLLGAMTAAGLWMRNDDEAKDQGYVVDLSETLQAPSIDDDLDYDPAFQEAGSTNVENPDQSHSASMSEGVQNGLKTGSEGTTWKVGTSGRIQAAEQEPGTDQISEEAKIPELNENEADETDMAALSTAMQPTLSFSDEDTLVWPIVGNVLINYSMDKTVYFPTLEQYKYSPAIVIEANEGDLVTAAAAGKVNKVFYDPEIGNAVQVELGDGYEVTYGQLKDVLVSEGSYVAMGDMIASVAAPTRYYSTEGTNVYFKLTKDGNPVNPMTKLR